MTVKQSRRAPGQHQRTTSRIWIWAQHFFLFAGIAFLSVVAVALADSASYSRHFHRLHTTHHEGGSQSERENAPRLTDSTPNKSNIGVLNIPRLNMTIPLFDGTEWTTLNHGVGRIVGTAHPGEPGNLGIAGHRDTYFRGLRNIRLGDLIELQRTEGIDTYRVDRLRIVMPSDVSVLRPSAVPTVTLVTCYPFYFLGSAPKRFVVTASLVTQTYTGEAATDVGSTTSINPLNKEKQ
jgi:LPXTG-site transpeptidase (sortase) family protein